MMITFEILCDRMYKSLFFIQLLSTIDIYALLGNSYMPIKEFPYF